MSDIVERLRACAEHKAMWSPWLANQAADTITRLTEEVERLTGERDRQYDYNAGQIVKQAAFEAEVERKDAALKQAGTGLNAGLFQYAARDIHGNIVPGDGQYPWIRAMQIGLDSVTAALSASRPHSQETSNDQG